MKKLEVTIIAVNGPIVRAEQVQDDLFVAMDIVYDKLYLQLERYKNRAQHKNQHTYEINVAYRIYHGGYGIIEDE